MCNNVSIYALFYDLQMWRHFHQNTHFRHYIAWRVGLCYDISLYLSQWLTLNKSLLAAPSVPMCYILRSDLQPPPQYDAVAPVLHDDRKNFLRYWPFVREIHRSPVNSPLKGQWHGALMFSLIWVWLNGWVNNHKAGDLRHHRAHCDVPVMW